MNNEIKEKLKLIDGFFNKAWACDLDEVYHAVIDTITNLQQENERLKEELQQEKKDFKEANDYCFELQDYKTRNKKAVEELELWQPKIESLKLEKEYLLNILNGRSAE